MTEPTASRYAFATRAVHIGNDVDPGSGAIKRPLTMANSYALPYDPTAYNWSQAATGFYVRNGGDNQRFLEERLCSLESAEACIVLASGVAALSGLFFSLLSVGDHILCASVTYMAVYRLMTEILPKYGIETTLVDTTDLTAIEAAIRPNTKLIHIETPANPTLSVTDISPVADIAHRHGALLSVDNTFASPYNQRPLELGADFGIKRAWRCHGWRHSRPKTATGADSSPGSNQYGWHHQPFQCMADHARQHHPAAADAAA